MKYKECFEIMGKERNSYSKTDIGATFMRMKEDHMKNGQLKPAYDEQTDANKYKVMKINEYWEELQAESHANILSGEGIVNRQIRSIQTEGHFGDIKENEDFRRFNHRSKDKAYKEFLLFAIGRNINKYHRFLQGTLKKFEGKTEQTAA